MSAVDETTGEPKEAPVRRGLVSEMEARHQEWAQSQPTVARCIFCPDWKSEGTAAETTEAAAAHRAALHPEAVRKRGRKAQQRVDAEKAAEQRRQTLALRAMDEGTAQPLPPVPAPQEPARRALPPIKGVRRQWTREIAMLALELYVEKHGHPPTTTVIDSDVPSNSVATRLFGSWANYIEAGGHPRPTRGTNYNRQRRVAEVAGIPIVADDTVPPGTVEIHENGHVVGAIVGVAEEPIAAGETGKVTLLARRPIGVTISRRTRTAFAEFLHALADDVAG